MKNAQKPINYNCKKRLQEYPQSQQFLGDLKSWMEHNGATTWWWSVGELYSKVQLFWEDYTNFRNLSHGFDICLVDIIVEGVQGLVKVGSDHSIDSCPISTQGNSANTDWIHEALKRSNPWTNLVAVKTMRRIMQIFVAFSECMNFKRKALKQDWKGCQTYWLRNEWQIF